MEVILLERIAKLGQMGDTVNVKSGYARNYLLPQGKALRANRESLAKFEGQRVELEARNLERKTEAEKVKDKLDGSTYIVIRSAGQTGQLYGSVSPRDIATSLEENGFKVVRSQVNLTAPIKVIGLHTLIIALHPEVEANVTVNVARSEDEAELQAAGKDLTGRGDHEVDEPEEESVDLTEVFENPDEVELSDDEPVEETEEDAATDGSDEVGDTAEPEEETSEEDASEEEAPKE